MEAQNDDIVSGNTDSRVVATLAAGNYTIEATTYNAAITGSFTLTMSGLGAGASEDPGTQETDACGATISGDGTVSGTWAAGCQSQVSGRGYARYFSFNLAQESQVTIDLESSVDTYLYLRRGEASSGTVLHENDDVETGVDTDSRIVATMAAGSYTIEATTYNAATTGSFTLTIAGLGTAGTGDGGTGSPDSCGTTLTGEGAVSGSWSAGCQSEVPGRGYARYYSFTLGEEQEITIDLESSVDTYLYLRSGEAKNGTALRENDDVETGVDTDSRISERLSAGTYTIEATTYNAAQAGSFTLTISGLSTAGAGGTGQTPDTTDSCGGTVTGDGATSGTWAAGCQSQVSGRGYARYYSFTLGEEQEITIDLESSVDTYLYLRSGQSRSGAVLHENDDVESGNTNSQISQTLAAGTYTIEATTYSTGQAGSFTLTISGLSTAGAG